MTMRINSLRSFVGIACISVFCGACIPSLNKKTENKNVPEGYSNAPKDTVNSAKVNWKEFFTDPYLHALIDTALRNNQQLNVVLQEINIARNEVRARKGQYLPFVNAGVQAGVEKTPRYTRSGAVDANTEIAPGREFPDPLPDFLVGANVSWEIDIWKRLRNAKKAAVYRYLSTTAGKNFMVTNLIAEIANAYYELMALDNQLLILQSNIKIQQNALAIVKMEKEAAKVTELAVKRFEAEVLKNQSRQYYIAQQITITSNRINFLVGRYPRQLERNSANFIEMVPDTIHTGIPSQLLQNRPDIKQAELDLMANKLDIKIAKASFYPMVNITGAIGVEAFNASYLITKTGSLMYYIMAGLTGPVVNRNAIRAAYLSANARQIQAVYDYERTILQAYMEVSNQVSNISNLKKSYDLKTKQVEALVTSIDVSTRLFRSARADYMEVLLTQRDALEARFDLVETKKQQLNARVDIYQALGGGWN